MPRTTLNDFISKHPKCCFCGGQSDTATRDHVPPKIMFRRKQWPDGYEFPACRACNSGSRLMDQSLALLVQASIDDPSYDHGDFTKVLGGVRNNTPTVEPVRITSAIEIRKILRHLGIERPHGVLFLRDLNLAGISTESYRAVDRVLRKLFCALHYKHTQRIVPTGAVLFRRRTSNQNRFAPDPFGWMAEFPASRTPIIQRQGEALTDQFDYRWDNYASDHFVIKFHLRHGMYGVMIGPLLHEWHDEVDPDDLMRV
jgi:hypothetical protein